MIVLLTQQVGNANLNLPSFISCKERTLILCTGCDIKMERDILGVLFLPCQSKDHKRSFVSRLILNCDIQPSKSSKERNQYCAPRKSMESITVNFQEAGQCSQQFGILYNSCHPFYVFFLTELVLCQLQHATLCQ